MSPQTRFILNTKFLLLCCRCYFDGVVVATAVAFGSCDGWRWQKCRVCVNLDAVFVVGDGDVDTNAIKPLKCL